MLCIETWSFRRHDVWPTELSGLRPTGWEEREGVRGSGEALAGEKAAGISHLGVSGQSHQCHHRMA